LSCPKAQLADKNHLARLFIIRFMESEVRRLSQTTNDAARTPSGHIGNAVWGLLAATLIAIGALATALLLPTPTPDSLTNPDAAGTATLTVTPQRYDGAHDIHMSPTLADAQVVRTQAWGVVTRTDLRAGATVASGGAPLSVNGQPLLALATAVPLWRDLGAGIKGVDVSALQTELARLGYAVEPSGTYGSATQAAVRDLLTAVGGTSTNGSLPLAAVLWLPEPEITVASSTLRVGDSVAAGDAVAQMAGALRSLAMAEPPGNGWVVRYGDATAPIDQVGRVTDAAFLAMFEGTPEMQYHLDSGGKNLVAIEAALAEPRDVLVVPPGAVIPITAGKGCVVSEGRTVPVDIVSAALGRTMVAVTDGSTPTEIVIRPDPTVRCS
jgi:peptidoglycan hydrolase-like protein with peptidoglycan-binding domain